MNHTPNTIEDHVALLGRERSHTGGDSPRPQLSIVIVAQGIKGRLTDTYVRLALQVAALDRELELIIIDDVGPESIWGDILDIAAGDPRVRGIRFAMHAGRSRALAAGCKAAHGSVVFTMSANVGNDAKQIDRCLQKLDEGYDVVSSCPGLSAAEGDESAIASAGETDADYTCYRKHVLKDLLVAGLKTSAIRDLAAKRGYRIARMTRVMAPAIRVYREEGFSVSRSMMETGALVRPRTASATDGAVTTVGASRAKSPRPTVAPTIRAAAAGHLACRSSTPFASESPLVLVADDESSFRSMVRLRLELGGYAVREAHSGMSVLTHLSKDLGVIVLDINMPGGLQGMECLLEIRKRRSDIQVIVLTGAVGIESAVEAMRLGAFDYLQKPCAGEALLGSVRRALQVRSDAETQAKPGLVA